MADEWTNESVVWQEETSRPMHSFRKGRKDLDWTRDDKDEKIEQNLDRFDKSQSLMEWGGEGLGGVGDASVF